MTTLKLRNLFVALGLLFLASGCVSLSTLQTARTLPPDKEEHSIGGGLYSSTPLSGSDAKLESSFFEYAFRRGFSEKIDYGLRLTIIGTAFVDAKYNLINDEKFAMAVGGGIGYMGISSGEGSNKSEVQIYDFNLPLYLSYDITPSVSLYGAPKVIFRYVSGGDIQSQALLAATAGIKLGTDKGVMLEATAVQESGKAFSGSQFNGVFFWTL
jgi:hypothetical protein